jgi:hypothetical protein
MIGFMRDIQETPLNIPIFTKDEMASIDEGEEMTIPKKKVDKLEDIYSKYFDKDKMSIDEYWNLVLYGELPK